MAQQQPRLRGVIFDMDGVLVDSEAYIRKAAMRMFDRTHGVRTRPEDFTPFVGQGENRYLGGVAEKYGVALDIDRDKATTYAIYLEVIRGRLDPLPGVREFIAACRDASRRLAVATSADRVKMVGNLREIGLPVETFDVCVTGSEVCRKKPDPEIFLTAASGLELPANRCLVVEDAPSGVRAAKAAGCACLGLTTSFDPATLRESGADWIGRDLSDVPAEVLAALGPG